MGTDICSESIEGEANYRLSVTVKRALCLKNVEVIGKSDPYCKLQLCGQEHRTVVKKNTLDPEVRLHLPYFALWKRLNVKPFCTVHSGTKHSNSRCEVLSVRLWKVSFGTTTGKASLLYICDRSFHFYFGGFFLGMASLRMIPHRALGRFSIPLAGLDLGSRDEWFDIQQGTGRIEVHMRLTKVLSTRL